MEIHAGAITDILTGQTRDNTLSTLTGFTVLASFVTRATVASVSLEVVTSAFASRLTCGTAQIAGSIATDFTLLALGPTSTAVFTIVFGVHTNIVAVGLTFRAGRLNTLALVTIVLTGAVLYLGAPLEAATSIFDTNLVLTGTNIGLRRTIPRVFLALVTRAIGNTLVVFALLKVFANSPTFAFAPNTTSALLGPFHTGFAVGWQTPLGGTWSTLHTFVIHTSRVVLVGAVFVLQTLDTSARSVAFFAGWTVFVGTTNALVVLGAFFGGAGIRLAMCVLQTRNTATLATAAV